MNLFLNKNQRHLAILSKLKNPVPGILVLASARLSYPNPLLVERYCCGHVPITQIGTKISVILPSSANSRIPSQEYWFSLRPDSVTRIPSWSKDIAAVTSLSPRSEQKSASSCHPQQTQESRPRNTGSRFGQTQLPESPLGRKILLRSRPYHPDRNKNQRHLAILSKLKNPVPGILVLASARLSYPNPLLVERYCCGHVPITQIGTKISVILPSSANSRIPSQEYWFSLRPDSVTRIPSWSKDIAAVTSLSP